MLSVVQFLQKTSCDGVEGFPKPLDLTEEFPILNLSDEANKTDSRSLEIT